MAINAEKGEARELVPARGYLAVLIGIYDIGTQLGGQYGPDHKVIFEYELHTRKGVCRDIKGNALTITDWLSIRLGVSKPSPLRMALEALTGRVIDDKSFAVDDSLLEKGCRIQVTHKVTNGTTRAIIASYQSLDDDEDVPEPVSDSYYYEIGADRQIPDRVPKWIHKWILQSREFGGKAPSQGGNGNSGRVTVPPDDDDDNENAPAY